MLSFEDLMTRLNICDSESTESTDVSQTLRLLIDKLSESHRFVTVSSACVTAWLWIMCVFVNGRIIAAFLIRSPVKRCKERCLEEANQLLRQVPDASLRALEERHLLPLVRLLLCMQLHTVSISTACRKVDQVSPRARLLTAQPSKTRPDTHCNLTFVWQMLQHLANVNHQLVYNETRLCLQSIVHAEQVQSSHSVCMSHIRTQD